MAKKPRIVSGIQPTGKIHVGNYLGALKNFVEIQKSGKYECFYFIADLHSLSENYDPKEKIGQIYDLLATMLSVGVDPKKSTIFLQSQIHEHTELGWLFSCVTPIAELERMTQYKDKASRQEKNINTALLTYPVLQAADILLYNGDYVPVGQDQVQHVELTRIVARKMNNRFKTQFPESMPLLSDSPKIMSLQEPTKKMSKSLGEASVINIFDDPKINEQKIKRAVSAANAIEGEPAFDNLFNLLKHFGTKKTIEQFTNSKGILFSELKTSVAQSINEYFSTFRQSYLKLQKDHKKLDTILKAGKTKAQKIAAETLKSTKQKMGLL